MDRSSLKANVEAAKAALRAAERELEDSYGPTLPLLARLLGEMFSADEARRFLRYSPGMSRFMDELPGAGTTAADVYRAIARCFIEAEIPGSKLRESLISERPRRKETIDAFMVNWPF